MIDTIPAHELERRKALRLRLRKDIVVESQKYEGRTFHVLKDPVSLRYYRLKDNEHFLLQFLDGERTLEEAQKAYEKRYRPERLKLEDLEAFAQQLLTAGLAQNESPRAGSQLFERRTKRRRTEWLQTFTNILYIKIPLIDPDRLLTRMLRYTGFVFSMWFFVLSVGFMLSAVMLVATHFDTFRSKFPSYHEFFRFQTVVYLWASLAVVKVIHEFGHGISCKRFGGEVHEMGALFLCLSPALYCNVSDAWTLPNKWHRIVISGAGIYVELLIAAIATFVWWNTPSHPFINNLSLSLMVVCSVSTVVFNANPLMRYDGYYVMADWLEIPNLREKSNRYLMNLVLEHCLGIEVQPEGYMELTRRILFVSYAIVSYVYRWVVTFAILWFMYNFLRPYKLEVISTLLALAAIASMTIWPVYRLCRNIYRRGRLPDMKRWRVMVTGSVLAAMVLFVFLVPVPLSRVRAVGLVEAPPDAMSKVSVRYPGQLIKLNVRDGQHVEKDEVLAEFQNLDSDLKLQKARREERNNIEKLIYLENQRRNAKPAEQNRIDLEIATATGDRNNATKEIAHEDHVQREELVLRAPRAGIVSQAPVVEQLGRTYDKDEPFCVIHTPGRLRVLLPVETPDFNRLKENLEKSTNASRASWRRLRDRATVDYKGMALKDVLNDLEGKFKDLHFDLNLEPKDLGAPVTFAADKKSLMAILDGILTPLNLGFVINAAEGDKKDGWLIVKPGDERGIIDGPLELNELPITLRVHGRDVKTWKGRIVRLPGKEAETIPLPLSSRANGPVAVKGGVRSNSLVPQTQHYLIYVDIVDPDAAIMPGSMAQVKVSCKNETCAHWLWRTVNGLFDLGII
jgi:putative peptide zinc metalloprotease protein